MSLFRCPLCGKQNSIRFYDPTDFDDDIIIILKRGLGYGRGFEEVDRYSLLDGSDPELLDLISDRVAILYDMLYEDVEDDKAEENDLDEIEEDEDEADLEDEDEEDEVDFESLSDLDKEIFLFEREEAEDKKEDEDINDFEEEIIVA